MKLKIDTGVEFEIQIEKTSGTPSGNSYWVVTYLVGGTPIYSVHTGPMSGKPCPLDILDWDHKCSVRDFSSPRPGPYKGTLLGRAYEWSDDTPGACRASCDSREGSILYITQRHGDWLRQCLASFVD